MIDYVEKKIKKKYVKQFLDASIKEAENLRSKKRDFIFFCLGIGLGIFGSLFASILYESFKDSIIYKMVVVFLFCLIIVVAWSYYRDLLDWESFNEHSIRKYNKILKGKGHLAICIPKDKKEVLSKELRDMIGK